MLLSLILRNSAMTQMGLPECVTSETYGMAFLNTKLLCCCAFFDGFDFQLDENFAHK